MAKVSEAAVVNELKWEKLPKTVYNEEEGKLTVYLPGFTYSDVDKTGNLTLWSAASYAEAGRAQIFFDPKLPFCETFLKGYFYMASAMYEFTPHFYDKACRYNPLSDEVNVTNIGRSSYTQYDKIRSIVTGEMLFTSTVVLVHVDKTSRKPSSLPPSFKERFGAKVLSLSGDKIQRIDRPTRTHIVQYQIQWSDCDFFRHSNQSSYVRYCYNAAETLVRLNVFKNIQGELGNYRVCRVTCLYLEETKPGEIANLHVWEDESNKWILYFHIEISKFLRYQGSIEFQDPGHETDRQKLQKAKL